MTTTCNDTATIPLATSLLAATLRDRHYSEYAVGRIVRHARGRGTLEGCVELEPEDRAAADEALELGQPAVVQASGLWDRDAARWAIGGGEE